MKEFEKTYNKSRIILTEGAIVERLKSEFNVELDSYINHAGLIYSNPEILELLYRQYIDIAQEYNLPIMIMTPTRKVNFETIIKSKIPDKSILSDTCSFLNKIRDNYKGFAPNIFIGGLLGCKGDAYSSKDALNIEESYEFHRKQVIQFSEENIDFLFAGIMPEINETLGMARAMADTEIPYIISFMIRKDGCLIDGTSICEAIKIIDNQVNRQPICYMTNCVHPTNLRLALTNERNKNHPQLFRFKGVQANASNLSPEELNNSKVLKQGDFYDMVNEMELLHKQFDLKILGGCCGTNDKFIDILSKRMIDQS